MPIQFPIAEPIESFHQKYLKAKRGWMEGTVPESTSVFSQMPLTNEGVDYNASLPVKIASGILEGLLGGAPGSPEMVQSGILGAVGMPVYDVLHYGPAPVNKFSYASQRENYGRGFLANKDPDKISMMRSKYGYTQGTPGILGPGFYAYADAIRPGSYAYDDVFKILPTNEMTEYASKHNLVPTKAQFDFKRPLDLTRVGSIKPNEYVKLIDEIREMYPNMGFGKVPKPSESISGKDFMREFLGRMPGKHEKVSLRRIAERAGFDGILYESDIVGNVASSPGYITAIAFKEKSTKVIK